MIDIEVLIMKMKMLVMMMLVMMMVNSDQYLVMLDQTRCSGDERSGVTRVTGAEQVSAGLTWTLDKLDQLNIVNKDSIGENKTIRSRPR